MKTNVRVSSVSKFAFYVSFKSTLKTRPRKNMCFEHDEPSLKTIKRIQSTHTQYKIEKTSSFSDKLSSIVVLHNITNIDLFIMQILLDINKPKGRKRISLLLKLK